MNACGVQIRDIPVAPGRASWHRPSMSTKLLAQKVDELTKRVESLETKIERAPKGAWRELIGSQEDDELFHDAVRLGAEWRAKANAEGR